MDEEHCRFCAVVPIKKCPKANSLTSQLLQFQYEQEFVFYFAKPVNDILRGCHTREAILYREFEMTDKFRRLLLEKYSGQYLKDEFAKLVKKAGSKVLQPHLAGHVAWCTIVVNSAHNRGHTTNCSNTRERKKQVGRYPLRQGSLMGPVLPFGGKLTRFADPVSYSTTMHDIYHPAYSVEVAQQVKDEEEIRRESIFLERMYDKKLKPKVPTLDIRGLITTQQKMGGRESDNIAAKSLIMGTTGQYSTQPSMEHKSRIFLAPKMGDSLKSRVKGLRDKSNDRSVKTAKNGLGIEFNELLTLDKRRSPKPEGWKEFFHSARLLKPKEKVKEKSTGATRLLKNSKPEIRNSLATNEIQISQTTRNRPLAGSISKLSAKKSLVERFANHRQRTNGTHQSFRTGMGIALSTARPTLQMVKEQLAKLSGKETIDKTKFNTVSSSKRVLQNSITKQRTISFSHDHRVVSERVGHHLSSQHPGAEALIQNSKKRVFKEKMFSSTDNLHRTINGSSLLTLIRPGGLQQHSAQRERKAASGQFNTHNRIHLPPETTLMLQGRERIKSLPKDPTIYQTAVKSSTIQPPITRRLFSSSEKAINHHTGRSSKNRMKTPIKQSQSSIKPKKSKTKLILQVAEMFARQRAHQYSGSRSKSPGHN